MDNLRSLVGKSEVDEFLCIPGGLPFGDVIENLIVWIIFISRRKTIYFDGLQLRGVHGSSLGNKGHRTARRIFDGLDDHGGSIGLEMMHDVLVFHNLAPEVFVDGGISARDNHNDRQVCSAHFLPVFNIAGENILKLIF